MQQATEIDIIAIGGSAGSLPVMGRIIRQLPDTLKVPVVLIVHRLKNVNSELGRLLSGDKIIIEPEDKEPIKKNQIYLAPQNYHLLIEADHTFSLDYSEPVNFSRPSIDESFYSVADAYGARSVGILLSGANNDGAAGLLSIVNAGGIGIAQQPAEAEFSIMPQAAIDLSSNIKIMREAEIISYILKYTVPSK
ncbi:chemotaxis protein CheB [Chitinophaga sp. Hz27]|uniref:chemotaxis protein CheB n=1 Tax=Chitinophaga sp. Hz27 TaxID=3347169 RepID=UPI0035E2E0FA